MVEAAVEETLRTWLSDYLGEVLEQAGYDRHQLPDPSDLERTSEVDWSPESSPTVLMVVSPGMDDDAIRVDNHLDLSFDVRAAFLVSEKTRIDARLAAQFYTAAAGWCLQQKGIDMDGSDVIFNREVWGSGRLTDRDARTVMTGEAQMTVIVRGARKMYGGPVEPSGGTRPPEPDDPVAEEYVGTIHKEPLSADFPDHYELED